MGSGEPMVNIRVTPAEMAVLDAAAQASTRKRAVWCREVLLAAARSLWTFEEILALLAGTDPRPARWVRVRAVLLREATVRYQQIRRALTRRGGNSDG